MSMITTNPLSNGANYQASIAPILMDLEGIVPTVYVDNVGNATIGAGFLISATNVPAILNAIDPSLQNILSPSGYKNLENAITTATKNVSFATAVAAQTAIQDAIYGTLNSPASYPGGVLPTSIPTFIFEYSTDPATASAQIQATLNSIIQTYEDRVNEWLNGSPTNTATAIGQSRERLVLLSLAYNNLIGFTTEKDANGNPVLDANGNAIQVVRSPSLLNDILTGNRAAAWYEIRYNSNGGNSASAGIATRRFYESTLFGLYADPNNPTLTESMQAYQVLQQHRVEILNYEAQYGLVPGAAGSGASALQNVLTSYGANAPAGSILTAAGLTSTPTLQSMYNPAATELFSVLASTYANLPEVASALVPANFLSTNVYVAPTVGAATVDVGVGDAFLGSASIATNPILANHLLLGSVSGDVLIGGSGNDILIAGDGTETLFAGAGTDTLVSGSGADTLIGGTSASSSDTYDILAGQAAYTGNSAAAGTVQTIVANADGVGAIKVNGVTVSTTTATGGAVAVSGSPDTWIANGYQFQFSSGASSTIGTLTITAPGSATLNGGSIVVQDFNLEQAVNGGGFLGLSFLNKTSLNQGANLGVDPPAIFPAGSEQAYTFAVGVPSTAAQTVTFTLAGASASDFEVVANGQPAAPLGANGSFTVTLAAGETAVSFGLVDVTGGAASDISGGATLQLAASMPDLANPNGTPITTAPLAITYMPGVVTTGTATAVIPGTVTSVYGVPTTAYQGDGGNDVIDMTGSTTTDNLVNLANGFNTVTGAAGQQDTISGYGTTGSSVIVGNGATDVIVAGGGNNQIYANTQETLSQAVATAGSASATNQRGDMIAVGDGNNTIVGGNGNDYIAAGAGHDVIVLGSGADTFLGGQNVTGASTNWNVSRVNGPLVLTGISGYPPTYSNPYPQPYNGYGLTGSPGTPNAGVSNDTVYGGSGTDVIIVGNGDNLVVGGSGSETIIGGMGNDTLIAGSGAEFVRGGGGTTYIQGGAGSDTLDGGDGNNTILGGSGNTTIFSANGPNNLSYGYTGANLEQNYVNGGSGNDVIYGSAGSDTLIAGSGNTTIQGGQGNESIVGGSGNDSLLAGDAANATISAGGSGTDTLQAGTVSSGTYILYGGGGTDSILGGSGTDSLFAGDGGTSTAATSVWGGSGNTTIFGGAGVDSLQGGSGNTVIYGGAGSSVAPTTIVAGSGDTTVYGGLGTDFIQGGIGNDVLYAGDGGTTAAPTTVNAGTGITKLVGGAGVSVLQDTVSGQDVLQGGSGSDTIYARGNDTVVAGTGSDFVQNSGGSLTLQVNPGFGNVAVVGSGSVNLALGPGMAPTDFTGGVAFDASGNPVLTLTGDGGSIELAGGVTGSLGGVALSGAGSITAGAMLASAFGGDQTVPSASGSSNFVLGVQSGDILAAQSASDTVSSFAANSTIQGYTGPGAASAEHLYAFGNAAAVNGGSGVDTVFASGSSDKVQGSASGADVTIVGSVSRFVGGGSGVDTVFASGSSDTVQGGASGTDVTITGSGSEFVGGSSGVDTVLASGSADTVNSGASGADVTLSGANSEFVGSGASSSVTATGTGDTLIGGSADRFYVQDASTLVQAAAGTQDTIYSSVSYIAPANVDNLVLTGSANISATGNGAADMLTAGAGNDTLYAGSAADTLVAGTGADSLVGVGANTYAIGSNSSNVVISTGTGGGTIDFGAGIAPSSLTVGMTMGTDGSPALLLQDGAMSVTVDGGLTGGIGLFDFAGGQSLTLAQLLNDAGQVVSNTITGALGNAIFEATAATSISGGLGNDTIFAAGAADTIFAGAGNQQIVGLQPGDVLVAGTGSDTLRGGGGNETLIAGAGSTAMYGGSGNDTFELTSGGSAVLYAGTTPGVEEIVLPSGMTMSDFIETFDPQNPNTLILQSTTGNTTLAIPNYYAAGSNASQDLWLVASGTQAPQVLNPPAPPQNLGYQQEIAALEKGFSAELTSSLQNDGLSITSQPPGFIYQFNGVSTQDMTVQGGVASVPTSDIAQSSTYPSGTTTVYVQQPVYQTRQAPGTVSFISLSSLRNARLITQDSAATPVYQNGTLIGYNLVTPPLTYTVLATTPVPETVTTYTTQTTQSYVVYNITGDGGNDTINSQGPTGNPVFYGTWSTNSNNPVFYGTVNTGNGNVSVDLGSLFMPFYRPQIGAFVQAGSGNDTISGTGVADIIAAGTGFDCISGGQGSTFYVPMQGYSTDVIEDPTFPYGGMVAQDPGTKLVLPAGVTLSNLRYRIFQDPTSGAQVLELQTGNSTVLINYGLSSSPWQGSPNPPGVPGTVVVPSGVATFQLSDGTVMTYNEFIAGLSSSATLLPNDFNPVVQAAAQPIVRAGQAVAANTLFSASDTVNNPITWYRISNSGTGGGYFELNGTAQAAGQPFLVNAGQLAQLQYVGGTPGSADAIQVSAFDGAIWSATSTIDVRMNVFEATAANQLVSGSTIGPDTLIGGFANDTLAGASGSDTFQYAAGTGPMTISDSATGANTLVFGPGITSSMISLGIAPDGGMLLRVGTNGDTIDIQGFQAQNALNSGAIQNFVFADGTTLTYAQLLARGFDIYGTTGNQVLTGTNLNNRIYAGSGNDTLIGSGANDTLVAGTGTDTLIGGSGAELFLVNNAADVVQVGATHGSDTILSSVNYVLPTGVDTLTLTGSANLVGTGNSDALNTITGNAGMDTLVAGAAVAMLIGGTGNDVFVVNNTADTVVAGGNDTILSSVSYTLPTGVDTMVLTGTANLSATGNADAANTLTGNSGNDTLTAGSGNDTLVSGTGVDTLVAGTGNDQFVVNNAADVVQVGATHGNDTILSSVGYALPTGVDTVVLTGTANLSATGNADAANSLTANSGNDTLTAGSGNDTLVSGSGADTLVGGAGADQFVVNNTADAVQVGATHGSDTILSSVNYVLPTGVDTLTLTGTANLSATGNSDAANTLTANSGSDTLQAGSGSDTLIGGSGNDLFVVNSATDSVQVGPTHGSDTVSSSVNYVLPTGVDTLALSGATNLTGTGNGDAANRLIANSGNDTLQAGSGADTLVAGAGIDTLLGGTGNDLFVVNNGADWVQVGSTHGADTISSSVSYMLPTGVETLALTGSSNLLGIGNFDGNNTLIANSGNDILLGFWGNDTLVSGSGIDLLIGGVGNDLFVVNNSSDIVIADPFGNNTISSSVSYTLPFGVDTLVLTGSGNLSAAGNWDPVNEIVANSGNDSLTGGYGVAFLEGGATAGQDLLQAQWNQAALLAGAGASTLTGGNYNDFFAAGKNADTISTGASANVVAVSLGDGATLLQPAAGAKSVLSLGGGIDAENLSFTKSGNNLVLHDGAAGDSITFANWYSGAPEQNYVTLQVIEQASASYNAASPDPLRNQAIEEFSFASLVNQFNAAGSPANWALSNGMSTAQLASSPTAANGGDLAYYFGMNGNLTGMALAAAQAALTSPQFATGVQTIDPWKQIQGAAGAPALR